MLSMFPILGCTPAPAGVGSGPEFGHPGGLVLEADGSLLVPDPVLGAVVRVDPVTGQRSILVGPAEGLFMPTAVARERRGALLVADAATGTVLRIDPRGRRPLGPPLAGPMRLALLPDRRLAVLVEDRNEILLMDPRTGDRELLTGPGRGAGPELDELSDLEVVGGRLLALNAMSAVIFEVDLQTGARRVVVDLRSGPDPILANPETMGPGGAGTLLVADDWTGRVFEVDPASGRRRVVSSPDQERGALVATVADPLRLPDGSVAVASGYWRTVLRVGPEGSRVLSGPEPPWRRLRIAPGALMADPGGLLLADLLRGAIMRLRGDALEEVSGPDRGEGPPLRIPLALAPDGQGNLYVADRVEGLFRVEVATGRRTRLRDLPGLPRPMDMVAAGPGEVLYVSTGLQSVLRVGPSAEVLSGPGRGEGPALQDTSRAWLAGPERLLVTDRGIQGLLQVDLRNGERSVLTGRGRGAGPAMGWPVFVLPHAEGLLVGDQETNALYRVRLPSGDRELLEGSGVGLYRPLGAALEGEDRLLVADPGVADLIEVDLRTGMRRPLHLRSPGPPPSSPGGG